MSARNVIIIGAPRSGTNMLRDVLTQRGGVVTWPCDEINAIWRYGSRRDASDEIATSQADARLQRFVERRFDTVRGDDPKSVVVEKTCANSLRVGYVAALVPDAHFVLITRDGMDAAASAAARWSAPVDWRYTARKARFVPAASLIHAGLRFTANRLAGRRNAKSHGRVWGPRFAGIDEMVASSTVEEVCAVQWQRCVELSHAALDRLPADRVHRLGYEDFVRRPEAGLVSLLDFLKLPAVGADVSVSRVSDRSIGKGRAALDAPATERVRRIIAPTLERLGYE